ncbi:OprD family outer membrane porin [Algivirga pacifica]|uniref:OprD family outer membrane porin n=1 Tax=Algivirga pacifica TaxID=1162670 RepID=UPI0031EA2C8A
MNNRKKTYLLFLLMGVSMFSAAQDSLWRNLVKGNIEGEWRSFYMATDNTEELKNFQALTTGGRVGYGTRFYKGWSLYTSLYLSQSLGIEDLTVQDIETRKGSRYEIGLLDVEDPSKRTVLLWGEAYLKYADDSQQLRIGRMRLNTPFLNLQDGRMIPTLVEGAWYKFGKEKWSVQGGAIWRIAPRSSSRFYGIGESIGVYPTGRSVTGDAAGYRDHTHSNLILIGNMNYTPNKSVKWELWDYWVHNIMHMPYTTLIWNKSSFNWKWTLGAQYALQHQIGEGGNEQLSNRYFDNNSVIHMVGTRLGAAYRGWKLTLNGNIIRGDGRFLFPREWGKEAFFTFQKRERSEGTANSEALMLQLSRQWEFTQWKLTMIAGYGYYWRNHPSEAINNKYAMPTYEHLNFDIFVNLGKRWKLEYLMAYKRSQDELAQQSGFIINKVDMVNHNLQLRYRIGG